jgi:hypothetical protein
LDNSLERVDIPIILNSISPSEIYDQKFSDETRVLTWDLQFTAKHSYMNPVRTSGLIKDININLWDINEI